MLCQFTFKNFRSYKEETILDFQATSIPEFKDTLLCDGKVGQMLPVNVIYGPNGGGKSNVLRALSCLISTVVKPIYDLKKTRSQNVVQYNIGATPFLFDDQSRNDPTLFEIFFRQGKNEYRYILSLKNEQIVKEALYWKAIGGKKTGMVFDRDGLEIKLGASFSQSSINRSVNPKMPYISFLAINYDLPMITEVQSWFETCILLSYADPNMEQGIYFPNEDSIQKQIVQALKGMDIGVSGYRLNKEDNHVYVQHIVKDRPFELRIEDESDGTKKLIGVLPFVILALQEGRLIVVDELDAKLHPKLLRYIITLFKNKKINTKGAQLLFTSHDMTTMKNTVFRRDEIWFAAANEDRESELYSLYEIRREDNERINNTAAFDKQYLEGRYGADPYLENMLSEENWQ